MSIPLIDRADPFTDRTAIIADGNRYSYSQLLGASSHIAKIFLDGEADLEEACVAFLVPPSAEYVAVQWGGWRAGAMVTALCTQHPKPELAYVLDDTKATIVVAHPDYEDLLRPLAEERNLRFYLTTDIVDFDQPNEAAALPDVDPDRNALIIYTSGTTGHPKGAVSTHSIVAAQITSLVEAWGWSQADHILEVLPLHHIHGIVNVTCCGMWSGATVEMLPRFDADAVWNRIAAADGMTLFMAVPTIYARLIKTWNTADDETKARMTEGCKKLRLMVSGSAALPVPTLETWRTISGHTLLERYGMTEIGMGLSNPLNGERMPGCVGRPLPRVEVRLVDEDGNVIGDGQPGQIQVKGPNVFKEYLGKPEATAEAFTSDGWFKTGDVAMREDGVYRILGRESVDIIKTGGFKVSALEIEDVLRTHDAISEVAVVGIEDEEWGQRVAATIVCNEGATIELEALRDWGKQRLATYKVPSMLLLVDELPRNPLGKVTKPAVVKLFENA